MTDSLTARAAEYLETLCTRHPDRHVGGEGNREATELFTEVCRAHGWRVEVTEFDCVAWERDGASLGAGDDSFEIFPGPYSLPYEGAAPLSAASTVEALEGGGFEGTILLLHGALASEQLMPKGFVFYNPDEHQRIIAALEAAKPLAVLAATGPHSMTPSIDPFPVIEDAEVMLPSAFLREADAPRLLAHQGRPVQLAIRSGRITKQGQHVVATRPGSGEGRLVIFGHVDTREDTPGALDNATAVAAMLVTAEELADHHGALTVEMVPLNGEDYYATPGQMLWVAQNEGRMEEIVLGMNADGAGYAGAPTAVSFYGVPDALVATVREAMAARPGFEDGEPWYQSDHGILMHYGRPVFAVTTSEFPHICAEYAHTERDTIELVDPAIVAEVGRFYADVIRRLSS